MTADPATVTIRIAAVNDAPTIAVVRALECGGASGTLGVHLADVDDAARSLVLSPSAAGIRVAAAGEGADRTLTLTRLSRRTRAALTGRGLGRLPVCVDLDHDRRRHEPP